MAAIPFSEALTALLALIGLVWVRRVFWMSAFRRGNPPLEAHPAPSPAPKISVIVPARDEEKNIAHCLAHLFKQNYPNYEILVVDDRSLDGTPAILAALKHNAPVPLRTVRIEKLPSGWTGKNYAMFTASRAAQGDWLLFTDADTTHAPGSVSTAAACALERNIDFLTLAPETECKSFWENVVQPLAVSSLALWFRTASINDPARKDTLANGQFILVKKEAYEKVGGNESVKNEVVEDVELAKRMKAQGLRVAFLNGTRIYSTRMYSTLKQIHTGWTRIFTYLFQKNIWAILHKVLLFLVFSISPFVLLMTEIILKFNNSEFFSSLVLWSASGVSAFIIFVRFLGNRLAHTNPWFAFMHPLGSLVMVWILLSCVTRVIFRQPSTWRGDKHF